ncbi:hypothetical protein C8R44DRAFT_875783 [Mycena epipterygia]|nr:hypothetical protein C8R44DRAFT_875783 [Mycena epipterygia]
MSSSTPTHPAPPARKPPTFGEEVATRFCLVGLLFLPTLVNVLLAVTYEYGPEGTPVDVSFVARTAGFLVFLTVVLCVSLTAGEMLSTRAHMLGMTAACFSGIVRFRGLVYQLRPLLPFFALFFHKKILPWVWDALLSELGMPGRVYGQRLVPAQPQAVGDGESMPLFSARVEDEEPIPGDNPAVHPKATRAVEPLPPYYTQPTGTASGSTSQTEVQAENGGTMAVDAGTVV